MATLDREFFARGTLTVARALLGKVVVRRTPGGKEHRARIVETEAYQGPKDRASHAYCGPTRRNEPMFGPAGVAYVYQIYGMYYCLNMVTGKNGFPAAVLVRAGEILDQGAHARDGAGPGKLCRAMGIDKRWTGTDLCSGDGIYVVDDGFRVPRKKVLSGPRIGVDYAGEWADKPWRFWIEDHPSVSRRR